MEACTLQSSSSYGPGKGPFFSDEVRQLLFPHRTQPKIFISIFPFKIQGKKLRSLNLFALMGTTLIIWEKVTFMCKYLTIFSLLQSLQEAQCLANQVEMYYCNPSESKKSLLEKFTFKPQEFKHQDLVDQLENISLLTENPSTKTLDNS